jgi:nucleotide-binding universal stress UspA family protein
MLPDARSRLASLPAVGRLGRGPAERAIGAEVAAHPYGLVIVPPAGRNALQRMLKGSRVATVVRSVETSVLVARRPPVRIERILAALSGGLGTPRVVDQALGLEKASGARATFFHVASEVALPYEPEAGGPPRPVVDPAAQAREALRGAGRELLVREGLVVEEVLEEVESGAYDLLVVGAPSEGGGWTREDVTERLLLACPTSVLIAR